MDADTAGQERERSEPSPIEEAAGERLGVERWDRPLIFRDAADAAVDNGLSYWLVLLLSGAIATLGLAMDSSAVVIGAMLVAPLLGPIMGLSLALAVGDSRLALQSLAIVGGSLAIVIVTAAGLTALLPFHTLTLEISSRITPTTLDLGVAVCSGLVGALVTIARGKRLSAAIPGVAVAVALIPPLAVAGFGMAAGWQTDVIWGALLLLGANLAGIVLSGVVVFLLIGMHRSDVVDAARKWHEDTEITGLAAWICRLPGAGKAKVFGSAPGRALLVLAFVAALAVPLTVALREVIRETRVSAAIEQAMELIEREGTTSVLWRSVELGPHSSTVRVRVATTVGVGADVREAFTTRATELAGEPVDLRLEQLPVAAGDASALQSLLHGRRIDVTESAMWPETVARARERLEQAAWSLPFPQGAEAIGVALHVEGGDTPIGSDSVEVSYLAPWPLEPQTEEVLGGALRTAVGHPGLRTSFHHAGPALLELQQTDTTALLTMITVLRRYPGLRVAVRSAGADSIATASIVAALRSAGVDSVDVERRSDPGPMELRMWRTTRSPGREPATLQ
ncbi:MAG: TIGR00341 family protein [Gemmatimonadetes bacterium]|nr:TIGR00341 family protein [Gemmatimonadota bacterium]